MPGSASDGCSGQIPESRTPTSTPSPALLDPPSEALMSRPPRDPKVTITNPQAVSRWLLYGAVLFGVTLATLLLAPGEMRSDGPSVPGPC